MASELRGNSGGEPSTAHALSIRGGQDDTNDESVKTNGLGEDHDEDHTNEDAVGLGIGSDTSVSSNTNGEASSQRGESTSQTSTEGLVSTLWSQVGIAHLARKDDSDDDAVNTQNTSHDNWNQGLEHLASVNDSQRGDANTGLGSSVRGTEVAEHKGGGNAKVTEEVGRGV